MSTVKISKNEKNTNISEILSFCFFCFKARLFALLYIYICLDRIFLLWYHIHVKFKEFIALVSAESPQTDSKGSGRKGNRSDRSDRRSSGREARAPVADVVRRSILRLIDHIGRAGVAVAVCERLLLSIEYIGFRILLEANSVRGQPSTEKICQEELI